jgi:hypothetical protein
MNCAIACGVIVQEADKFHGDSFELNRVWAQDELRLKKKMVG